MSNNKFSSFLKRLGLPAILTALGISMTSTTFAQNEVHVQDITMEKQDNFGPNFYQDTPTLDSSNIIGCDVDYSKITVPSQEEFSHMEEFLQANYDGKIFPGEPEHSRTEHLHVYCAMFDECCFSQNENGEMVYNKSIPEGYSSNSNLSTGYVVTSLNSDVLFSICENTEGWKPFIISSECSSITLNSNNKEEIPLNTDGQRCPSNASKLAGVVGYVACYQDAQRHLGSVSKGEMMGELGELFRKIENGEKLTPDDLASLVKARYGNEAR